MRILRHLTVAESHHYDQGAPVSFFPVWQLFYHLQKEQTFGEPRARFYTAEVASAIGYLHSLNIVYRSALAVDGSFTPPQQC